MFENSSSSCRNIDFEKEGYTIGRAKLKEPLSIPLLGASAAAKQVESLKGQRFTYSGAITKELATLRGSPPLGAAVAFQISVAFVVVTGCANKTVDLEYDVYAIPPPNLASGTTEFQNGAQKTTTSQPFHAAPDVVFAGWKQVSAGADLSYQSPNFSFGEKSTGSASAYNTTISGMGGFNFLGEISRVDVQFNGASSSSPTRVGQLAATQFSAQASATTRTFANGAFQGRFGGLAEGGNLHSALQPLQLPVNSVAGGEYAAAKFYGGLTWNTSHNVLSGSAGVEIGQVLSGAGGDWRKVVGDVTDDFWFPLPGHRTLEIEGRLGLGDVVSFRSIPVAERFFGGSTVTPFIPGDSWQINSGPSIRAIPADRFYVTAEGPGATSYKSLNSTFSYVVWSKPMVPDLVSREVGPLIDGQLTNAQSALTNSFAAGSSGFQDLLSHEIHDLGPALAQLNSDLANLAAAHPESQTQFDDCSDNVMLANFFLGKVNAAANNKDKYPLATTLPSSSLDDVSSSCGQLNDPVVAKDVAAVSAISKSITTRTDALVKSVQKQAFDDTAFARRTVHTVINTLNIISIAPVAVLDWADIGPAGSGIRGSRLGPGGGIRIELASYVSLTAGYAWNVNRQPGEGNGAAFFSIGVRNLFR